MSETDNSSMSSRQRLVHNLRKRSSRLKKALNGNFKAPSKSSQRINTPVEEIGTSAGSSVFLDSGKPKYKLYCIRNPSLDPSASWRSSSAVPEFNARGNLRLPKAEKINPAFTSDEARWAERVANESRLAEAQDSVTHLRQNQSLVEPVNAPLAPPPRKLKLKHQASDDLSLETSQQLTTADQNSTQVPVNSPQQSRRKVEEMKESQNLAESTYILPEPLIDNISPVDESIEKVRKELEGKDLDEDDDDIAPQRSTFLTQIDDSEPAKKISVLEAKTSFNKGSKITQGYGSFNFNIDV